MDNSGSTKKDLAVVADTPAVTGLKDTNSGVDAPEFLTVAQAAEALCIGRTAAYKAIANGAIPSIRVGPRLIRVPRKALAELEREALAG